MMATRSDNKSWWARAIVPVLFGSILAWASGLTTWLIAVDRRATVLEKQFEDKTKERDRQFARIDEALGKLESSNSVAHENICNKVEEIRKLIYNHMIDSKTKTSTTIFLGKGS